MVGGAFRDYVPNSNIAELAAVARGVRALLGTPIIADGDHILMQIDNMHVLGLLQTENPRVPGHEEGKLLRSIFESLRPRRIGWHVRHIKGHTNSDLPRYWVHNQCDQIARRYMLTLRQAHNRGIKPFEMIKSNRLYPLHVEWGRIVVPHPAPEPVP